MAVRWSVGCNTASMGKDGIHGIHEIHDHGVAQFHLRRSRRSPLNAAAAKATSLPPGAPERLNEDDRRWFDAKKPKKEAKNRNRKRITNFLFNKKCFLQEMFSDLKGLWSFPGGQSPRRSDRPEAGPSGIMNLVSLVLWSFGESIILSLADVETRPKSRQCRRLDANISWILDD